MTQTHITHKKATPKIGMAFLWFDVQGLASSAGPCID